jgi:hypothetical protein
MEYDVYCSKTTLIRQKKHGVCCLCQKIMYILATRAKRIVIIFESVDGVIIFFLKVKGWIPKFLDSCKSHEQESRVFVLNQWNSFLEGEESD